jgi:Zn-finger nucleic acid-binding protein
MWFGDEQLDNLKGEVLPDIAWLDLDIWKNQSEFKVSRSPNFCPACQGVALAKIANPDSPTELEMCVRCKGTWLGTGQFLNLTNDLLDIAEQVSIPEYAKISLQKAADMIKNPEASGANWTELKTVLGLLRHRVLAENPKLESMLEGLQKSMPL